MKPRQFNSIPQIVGLLLLSLLIVLSSCGTVAPYAERKQAAENIAQAKSVEADQLEPILFENSTNFFAEGESLIVTNKKDKKNTKAKEAYLSALTNALNAYNAAVGPYTQKFIDETDRKIEEAKLQKVENSSPELFQQALDQNRLAKDNLRDKLFQEAKSNTIAARDPLEEALAKQGEYKAKIADYEAQVALLMKKADENKSKNAVPDQYAENKSTHKDILRQTERGYYQESLSAYPSLIESLNKMLIDTENKRKLAIKELSEANKVITKIKNTSKGVDKEVENINKLDQPK